MTDDQASRCLDSIGHRPIVHLVFIRWVDRARPAVRGPRENKAMPNRRRNIKVLSRVLDDLDGRTFYDTYFNDPGFRTHLRDLANFGESHPEDALLLQEDLELIEEQ